MPGKDLENAVTSHQSGSTLALTVVPRSSRNRLELQEQGQVRVRIAAAPVDGAANAALMKFLASELGVPRSRLSILSGEASRTKRILVEGMDRIDLVRRLEEAAQAQS